MTRNPIRQAGVRDRFRKRPSWVPLAACPPVQLFSKQFLNLLCIAAALLSAAGCKSSPTVTSNGLGVPVPAGLEQASQPAKSSFSLRDITQLAKLGTAASQPTTPAASQPAATSFLAPGRTHLDLDPWKVIFLTFQNSLQIKVSYYKYAAEKARYDYIIATWTSTTPGFSIGPTWQRFKDNLDKRTITQTQYGEVFLDQNFQDTSRLHVYGGFLNEDYGDSSGAHPSAGAALHFPLWGSREALQRSSELIFQQNRLNDAQLEYVKDVRDELKWGLYFYYESMGIQLRTTANQGQLDDLQKVYERMQQAGSPQADLVRMQAALSTAATDLRNRQSNFDVMVNLMKRTMGLPMDLPVTVADELFNPFGEPDQEQLLALSMKSDPEIAALNNAAKNAEVQLALARKGRLDVGVDLAASTDAPGSGTWNDQEQYNASATLEVRFIDPRISNSLAREASADIARYQQEIARRKNEIYVGAMEPLIKFRPLLTNMEDMQRNIIRYRNDCAVGVEDYFAGRMNIDDLIRRRQSLMDEETHLADARNTFGVKMAELAQATGKYFEILQQRQAAGPNGLPTTQPADQPSTLPAEYGQSPAPPAGSTQLAPEQPMADQAR